jgi:outer membrane biosynthesis protein TonB
MKNALLLTPAATTASQTPEEEKRLEFELVETPDDAASDRTPENTNLVSDKNAVARDKYTGTDLADDDPFSEGQTEYKTFAGAIAPPSPPPQPITVPENAAEKQAEDAAENEAEKKEVEETSDEGPTSIMRKQQNESQKTISRNALQSILQPQTRSSLSSMSDDLTYRNVKSSAQDLGGVTLNTYAWDFAPYILEMKRKLRQNIYPPPAFTRLGLINGETVLRFKVMPDGAMRDLEVLAHKGHPSLQETSLNAVKNSSPFRHLPGDFPDEYLELTWTFIYSTIR